jgi:hypothetical protein
VKDALRGLRVGESVFARIAELLPGDELLISFDGDLLRVHNETRRALRVGDEVTLIVKAVKPLRFQLALERSEQRRKGRLDVSI